MSGTVVGATKIEDHGGSSLTRFTLVIIGDGFTSSDQIAFEDATTAFVNSLQAIAPFDDPDVWFQINVYRLDVYSTGSDLINPLSCGDDPADYVHVPPETQSTYFDASYCTYDTRRLLTVDHAAVINVATDLVPGWDAIVVIVNHQEYGGSGSEANGTAVYSLHLLSVNIALHELGHVLGLADEYDDLGGTYVGAEPSEPNVTTSITADKWSAQVTASALPTLENATCTPRAGSVIDPEPGAIGLYEGGKRYACGIYSPAFTCMMRDNTRAFCAVCEAHLRDRLLNGFYVQPASCFVASAVYGDASHPDVETLRRWRDRHLRAGSRGRPAMQLLAGIYGLVGPLLARFVGTQPWLAEAARRFLFQPLASWLRRRA